MKVLGTNLFAGTNDGVWRRPLSEMITSVERLSTDLPAHFSLVQNYPNPFNPSTTITYSLPLSSHVKLQIYNVLGQVVAELVDGEKAARWYSVTWNATTSSGIYFYRIEAFSTSDPSSRFMQVKKMLLLK